MDATEFTLIILAMIIPSALIFYILRRAFTLREKKLDIEALNAAEKAAQYVAHSREVEARLAVIERIVTDQPTMLASEIDRLSIDKGGNA
jgi:hypothetical protein